MLQRSFGTKKILQTRRGTFCKLDQEIHIAGGWVEVIGPCCRAKHVQAANAKALANGGDANTVLGDGRVPEGILGEGHQILTTTARIHS